MKTHAVFAAAAILLAACTPEFDPASRVEKLRVLAVQVEPPEIAPAPSDAGTAVAPDHATLRSLVVRADFAADPDRKTTVVHLSCVPVPGDPNPTPCVMLASLGDPTAIIADAAAASCAAPAPGAEAPPIALAGIEVCDRGGCGPATLAGGTTLPPPEVALPAGYGFDGLPGGAPERILGVQAEVLAFAVDATPDELAGGVTGPCPAASLGARLSQLWSEREHVLSVKRVRIRGPEAPDLPNRNPVVDGIAAAGAPLAPVDTVTAGEVLLTPVLPDGADALRESYTKLDAAGVAYERAREDWVYSWFSTAGELEDLHTRDPAAERWTVAAGERALVAAVVRDLRGGIAWTVREVTVAP